MLGWAPRLPGGLPLGRFDAVVDLWGGGVVAAADQLTEARPVQPLDYTEDLDCPLLGLFGEEDFSPTTDQVAVHEKELQRLGKDYEFHMYPGAGHGFFYHDRPAAYRAEQAVDGWNKVFDFFGRTLAGVKRRHVHEHRHERRAHREQQGPAGLVSRRQSGGHL